MGPNKLKKFCTAKETLNKMKRQPPNGRKYLEVKHLTKDLSPKYINTCCRGVYTPKNIRKTKQPHQKMGRTKQTILQRRHTDGKKTHEKMFNITHY